jgi:hypothetical protein
MALYLHLLRKLEHLNTRRKSKSCLQTKKFLHRQLDPARAGLVPGVEHGARGVKFVAAAVDSQEHGGLWRLL